MSEKIYDVAVIGGGPAGYVAAIRACQLGGSVVIFEKDTLGGTCLNRGCIPTKTYIKTAESIRTLRHAGERGVVVDTATLSVDMPRVVEYKNAVVKKLTDGIGLLLKSNKADIVRGTAVMKDATHIECEGELYEARNTILCGGSVAWKIPVPGVELPGVMTSDEILDITEIPARLAIVGGGIIGCEIATVFAAFGSGVTIIEALPKLAATLDSELSVAIKKQLTAAGVTIMLGASVEKIESADGALSVCCAGAAPVAADCVLLSVGRRADLGCLGALADSIATERGKIVTDDGMRTSLPNIYAAGDIVYGIPMLAHAAFKMGEAAAENAMGGSASADLRYTPSCLYTLPEAASVGLTEEQAKESGADIAIGRFRFLANGRALASGEPEGLVKVIIDKADNRLLGVHIVGAVAAEMITEPAALMSCGVTADKIAEVIHPHPSFSEAFLEAVTDALGRCIHAPVKRKL